MKMNLKFTIFSFLFVLFSSSFVTAEISMNDAKVLLKKAEDNTAFYETDFSGKYVVVQDKPGEGKSITEAIMYRRDRTGQWTVLVTGPDSEKGKGYLQTDGSIWFYDPADRRFTFTSAKDKFQGTNLNNSDFAPQRYYSDYNIESAKEEKLGSLHCVVFTLKANKKNVDYPKLKIWVTKDDGLVRKKEDYSLSGQLLRTTAIPSYQILQSKGRTYAIPEKMLLIDNLRGKKINGKVHYEKSQVTISKISFDKVENIVYTKPYLEMMSK